MRIEPSITSGYASKASESQYPNLWRGLQMAIVPKLGSQGSKLRNVSLNKNDFGVMQNMSPTASWSVGHDGRALALDGVNDYIVVPTSPGLSITGAITILFCFQAPNSLTGDDGGIISKSNDAGRFLGSAANAVWDTTIFNLNTFFTISNGTTKNQVFGPSAQILDNKPHIVSTVWDGTPTTDSMRIYFDAILKYKANSSITAMQDLGNDVVLGGFNTFLPFKGKVFFYYIYDRALSPAELWQIQRNNLAPFQLKDTLARSADIKANIQGYPSGYHDNGTFNVNMGMS